MPTDLTGAAERVSELARSLPWKGSGRLEILHVVEMTFEAVREGREAHARELLEILGNKARDASVGEVGTTLVRGRPDEEVPRYANAGEYSLLILAPGCHDTIDTAFGSVTSAVIRESATPVLLAPPGCDTTFYARGKT